MFKLIKILNSGSNLAEPVYLPANDSYGYTVGSLAKLKGGTLVPAEAMDSPTYLIGEERRRGEAKRILAYRITERMIFEAPVSTSPEKLRIGDRVTLDTASGITNAVTATKGGKALIIDLGSATRAGDRLYVLFPG